MTSGTKGFGATPEEMVLFELVAALIQTHPDPARVNAAFLARMKTLLENAPDGAEEDFVVEVRARMAQYSVILHRLTLPT